MGHPGGVCGKEGGGLREERWKEGELEEGLVGGMCVQGVLKKCPARPGDRD